MSPLHPIPLHIRFFLIDNAQFCKKHKILDEIGNKLNKVLDVNDLMKVVHEIPSNMFDKISEFVSSKGNKLEYMTFVKKYLFGFLLQDFFHRKHINAFYAVAVCSLIANDIIIKNNHKNATKYAIIATFLQMKPLVPIETIPFN